MCTLFVKSLCMPNPTLRFRCAFKDYKYCCFFNLQNVRTIFLSNSKQFLCNKNANTSKLNLAKRSTLYYVAAAGVFVCGMSYAAVPLYRIFCQVSCIVIQARPTKLASCRPNDKRLRVTTKGKRKGVATTLQAII